MRYLEKAMKSLSSVNPVLGWLQVSHKERRRLGVSYLTTKRPLFCVLSRTSEHLLMVCCFDPPSTAVIRTLPILSHKQLSYRIIDLSSHHNARPMLRYVYGLDNKEAAASALTAYSKAIGRY